MVFLPTSKHLGGKKAKVVLGCIVSLRTVWLAVYAVSLHVLSSSLETSALTCLGGSFYRFVVSHLNPVINLHSVCQLQQKIIETGMSLRLTLSRSYPGNVGVNAKASVV